MNLALIEVSDSVFLGYIGALAVSGLIMLILAVTGFGGTGALARVLNALFGLGFLGYAVYLFFFFEGTEFRFFWYALVLPVLMLVSAFRSRKKEEPAQATEG